MLEVPAPVYSGVALVLARGGACLSDAGWSSWQLVGLITRRSQVQVLLPQPSEEKAVLVGFSGVWKLL